MMKIQSPQEGPQKIQLGAIRTCQGCKFYNQLGTMFGEDRNEYANYCQHESVREKRYDVYGQDGRFIANTSGEPIQTPSWCPVLELRRTAK